MSGMFISRSFDRDKSACVQLFNLFENVRHYL